LPALQPITTECEKTRNRVKKKKLAPHEPLEAKKNDGRNQLVWEGSEQDDDSRKARQGGDHQVKNTDDNQTSFSRFLHLQEYSTSAKANQNAFKTFVYSLKHKNAVFGNFLCVYFLSLSLWCLCCISTLPEIAESTRDHRISSKAKQIYILPSPNNTTPQNVVKQKPPNFFFKFAEREQRQWSPRTRHKNRQQNPCTNCNCEQGEARKTSVQEKAELELGQRTKAQKAEEPGGKKKKRQENWTVPGSNPASSGPSPTPPAFPQTLKFKFWVGANHTTGLRGKGSRRGAAGAGILPFVT
jgi:hypothetical protein